MSLPTHNSGIFFLLADEGYPFYGQCLERVFESSVAGNNHYFHDRGGALLLSQLASGLSHTLDLRPYPAGTYILKIRTPNGTATKKIILQ